MWIGRESLWVAILWIGRVVSARDWRWIVAVAIVGGGDVAPLLQ